MPNTERYFQRLREGVQQPTDVVYGNFGVRFLAKFIDGIVRWIIGMVIGFGLAMAVFGHFIYQPKANDPAMLGKVMAFQGASLLLSMSIYLLYYWFFSQPIRGDLPERWRWD